MRWKESQAFTEGTDVNWSVSSNAESFHCGKRFQAQSALSKHIKRHTAIKGFSCNLCPKSFAVKTDLNAHIKFVHEKPTSSKGIPAENVNNISFE